MSAPVPPAERDPSDPRPIVALPRPGPSGAVIAAIAAVFAVLLFVALNGRRLERTETRVSTSGSAPFAEPPALIVPPAPALRAPSPEPLPTVVAQPLIRIAVPSPYVRDDPDVPSVAALAAAYPQQPAVHHETGAALIFDSGARSETAGATPSPAQTAAGDETPVGTTVIRNHTSIVATGTVIAATLETPIDSSRAGLIRAIVANDTRGFDGKRVLIPRGSRLIGEYAADIRVGQKRVLVTWTRLIRPDGVAVRIGSPGADLLGGSGVPGKVNSFFFQRFASAILQSVLSIGVNRASRQGKGSVFVGLPGAASDVTEQSLLASNDIKPRIRVKQGAAVTVFVAHDLDFSAAPVLQREWGG